MPLIFQLEVDVSSIALIAWIIHAVYVVSIPFWHRSDIVIVTFSFENVVSLTLYVIMNSNAWFDTMNLV